MGWKIIKIEQQCLLRVYLESLQIIFPDKKLLIPIIDIDVLIIENNRLTLSLHLINKLSSFNTCVIICDDKHLPSSIINPIIGNYINYDIFKKQLDWNQYYKDRTWNWIMTQKCKNQLLFIRDKIDVQEWNELIENKNFNFRNVNYESQIANLFFHNIFNNKDFNRKDDCLINRLFDYCYTIITSMVCRSVISKGLNQNIAFYHGSNVSRFPLAYDVVELFRSIVDFFIIQLFENNIFDYETNNFQKLKNLFLEYLSNVKVLIDDKKQYLNNSIDLVFDWIINQDYENHNLDTLSLLFNNDISLYETRYFLREYNDGKE